VLQELFRGQASIPPYHVRSSRCSSLILYSSDKNLLNSIIDLKTLELSGTGGVDLAREAGSSISNIRNAADHAAHAVDDIKQAIEEQSNAARDVAQRIEKIAQGTEENSLVASKTANEAKKMTELSRSLEELSRKFRIA
jgi:methyl-accepting chemotaxis protein